jgi:hypothetical protein
LFLSIQGLPQPWMCPACGDVATIITPILYCRGGCSWWCIGRAGSSDTSGWAGCWMHRTPQEALSHNHSSLSAQFCFGPWLVHMIHTCDMVLCRGSRKIIGRTKGKWLKIIKRHSI